MVDEFFVEDAFKSQLDAEALLLMHMNRIAIYRDTDMKRYCSSVETLILLCPRNIRERSLAYMNDLGLQRGMYSSITDDKRVIYDNLLMFINEQLEKQRMIWKKRSIKTYE
jgi:hypothetical protein